MIRLRIACGQFASRPANKAANLEKIRDLTGMAAEDGCQLIVFPELAITGYLDPTRMSAMAESLNGKCVRALQTIAGNTGIGIVCGTVEGDPQMTVRYNSAVAIDRNGRVLGAYRKIHLWDSEKQWATPGDAFPVFDFGGFRVASWICHDTRFPELGRLARQGKADIAVVPTAWLGPEREWDLALRSRAMDNQIAVAGADLIGAEAAFPCKGLSRISAADGRLLASTPAGREGIIAATIDLEAQEGLRHEIPLWQDRRPELYARLTSSL